MDQTTSSPAAPEPASARLRILDAYCELLLSGGERSATLDAVARQAGVSKGGLLYHFGSKEAMSDGLLERLGELAAIDVAAMRAAEDGAIAYLMLTSIDIDSTFDRAYNAVYRLGQAGNERAVETIRSIRAEWQRAVRDECGDDDAAHAIVLMSDGLYLSGAFHDTAGDDPQRFARRMLVVAHSLVR